MRFIKKCDDIVCSEELIWKKTKLKYNKNKSYICPSFMNRCMIILKLVTQVYEKRHIHRYRSYFQVEVCIFLLLRRFSKFLIKVELHKFSPPPTDWLIKR